MEHPYADRIKVRTAVVSLYGDMIIGETAATKKIPIRSVVKLQWQNHVPIKSLMERQRILVPIR